LAHGSYGGTSRPVLELYREFQTLIESQPVEFFYNILYPQIVHSLRSICKDMGAKPNEITFIPNVEFGTNAIFKSMIDSGRIKKGDKVFTFQLTYGAVKQSLQLYCDSIGAKLIQMDFRFPLQNEDDIIDQVKDFLERENTSRNMRFAVLEHITSSTAIIFPIQKLISLFHDQDMLVCVDGAHSLGQIEMHLNEWNPDFYVTNGHKWMCNPRGCGVLYVKEIYQSIIHPVVLTWGQGKGFHAEFIWQGTMDYCPMISLRYALHFFKWLGNGNIKNVIERNHQLILDGGHMLAKVWNTEMLVNDDMCGSMCVIQIPKDQSERECEDNCTRSDIHDILLKKYHIEAPVATFIQRTWIRVSCHVYNEKKDFFLLAKAILEIQKKDLSPLNEFESWNV